MDVDFMVYTFDFSDMDHNLHIMGQSLISKEDEPHIEWTQTALIKELQGRKNIDFYPEVLYFFYLLNNINYIMHFNFKKNLLSL